MKSSKYLPLYRQKNDWFKSVKISLEEVKKLCGECPYFYLVIGSNKYKEDGDNKPELIFAITSDDK